MRKYGLPYQGSKNRIAEQIVDLLPKNDCLVDLFCGGGAITDAAIDSKKWNHFIINDVQKGISQAVAHTFKVGANGADHWVSREEYQTRLFDDPMMRLLWSFGGNGRSYFCDPQKEALKKLAFELVTSNNQDERYKAYRKLITTLRDDIGSVPKSLEFLEPVVRAKNLIPLKKDPSIKVEHFEGDYQAVPIPENATIYCDIPYKDAERYRYAPKFDYERFYDWCAKQTAPLYISEYDMPRDRFVCVYEKNLTCTFDARKTKNSIERVFVPKHQA